MEKGGVKKGAPLEKSGRVPVFSPPFPMGKATREAYGETLVQLGREDERIVVLDADLSKSTMTRLFAKEFPERFFNFGIAEANMVSAAAGFAASGRIPFVSSFACFLTCKGYDQMRVSVALPGFPVKFVSSHGGISVGEDGPSQQSIEDIALMCSLPKMVVIVPADEVETAEAVRAVVRYPGPTYIRTGRPKAPKIYSGECPFQIGKYLRLKEGNDLTIFANGLLVAEALKAAQELEKEGILARVVDSATVKPPDTEEILKACEETQAVLVCEEHQIYGGLGSIIAREVSRLHPVPVDFIAILDTYAESGKPEELFDRYGLSARHIVQKAK
ncbi:MAG: transketolase family protein, partial [bacterium]